MFRFNLIICYFFQFFLDACYSALFGVNVTVTDTVFSFLLVFRIQGKMLLPKLQRTVTEPRVKGLDQWIIDKGDMLFV